jgi:hypothetical protein
MMIGLRRMMICLRQNEGEFPQAEIFDQIKVGSGGKVFGKFLRNFFSKKFLKSTSAEVETLSAQSNGRRPADVFAFGKSRLCFGG